MKESDKHSEQAAVAAYLLDKVGKLGLAEGVAVTAYATGKSASVTVMWPDDDEEEEGRL